MLVPLTIHYYFLSVQILVSPATAGINIAWMDAFMEECELLGCRIDYIGTHNYPGTGGAEQTMNRLKAFSERYGGRKILFTEFAVAKTHDENTIIEFIEDILPRQ